MKGRLKSFSLADLLLILVAVIWGVNVGLVKGALTEFNPLTFNSLRFCISALLSWAMIGIVKERALPAKRDVPALVLLGLLGHALYQVLFILGTNLTSVSNTALLLATIPVWVAALGAITKEEVAGPTTWVGISLSILGIILVTTRGSLSLGSGSWMGDVMLVTGTFFYGLYAFKSKKLLTIYSPLQFSTWTMTAGALGMSAVSLSQIRAQDWQVIGSHGWGGLAFSAVLAIALGYYVWANGIQKLGSARTAIYNNLTPVTAMLYSSILLQEKITFPQIAGAALIIAGLSLARRKKIKRRKPMRKDDVRDNYHGTIVADPYRWLEDSLSEDSQVWIGEQNDKTREFLDTPLRVELLRRLEELWNYPKYELPQEAGQRLFYQKNDGLQNQARLYCQEAEKKPFVILDPNTFSTDGTVALTNLSFSRDGSHLAYATSASGSDWQRIRILCVDTGEEYPETINWCRFTSLPWSPDGQGFYYSRYPEPGSVAPEDESNFNEVWYHRLGSLQDKDTLVYRRPDAKELSFMPLVSEDQQYLSLLVSHGTSSRNRFYYRSLTTDEDFALLLDQEDAAYWPLGNIGSRFYFNTDLDAPRGRIIAIDVNNPDKENWQEVVPQGEDVIAEARLAGGRLLLVYMHHACHRIRVFDIQGKEQGRVQLPALGSVTGLWGKSNRDTVYLGFMSFLYPPTVFKLELASLKLTPFAKTSLTFTPEAFETTQVFYSSKDGTKVPMFLTHKKGIKLEGNNPTLLYGYGGFNISMTPTFSPAQLLFIERGGVYAVANLRGGSEYGEDWHRGGMLENKQNVFDDFAAAAQWLVANNYTTRKRLAILGRSNGGLLVATAMTQNPELYGAVVCWVPVIDMLRYHKFTVGRFWLPEYGDAETNPDHFKFMYAYSPLHNVQENADYPPTLIMTADTDDRVIPGHALKFAATLQEKYKGPSPIYLRVETKAGHGPGKPISKLVEEAADIYTFLFQTIGS